MNKKKKKGTQLFQVSRTESIFTSPRLLWFPSTDQPLSTRSSTDMQGTHSPTVCQLPDNAQRHKGGRRCIFSCAKKSARQRQTLRLFNSRNFYSPISDTLISDTHQLPRSHRLSLNLNRALIPVSLCYIFICTWLLRGLVGLPTET